MFFSLFVGEVTNPEVSRVENVLEFVRKSERVCSSLLSSQFTNSKPAWRNLHFCNAKRRRRDPAKCLSQHVNRNRRMNVAAKRWETDKREDGLNAWRPLKDRWINANCIIVAFPIFSWPCLGNRLCPIRTQNRCSSLHVTSNSSSSSYMQKMINARHCTVDIMHSTSIQQQTDVCNQFRHYASVNHVSDRLRAD